jgi:hypothetical protein
MMLHFTLNACTFKRGKKIPSSLLDIKSISFYFFIFTSVQKEGILKHANLINCIWKYKDHKYKSNYYIKAIIVILRGLKSVPGYLYK